MSKKIKLTTKGVQKIQDVVGLERGFVNLKTGVITLEDRECSQEILEKLHNDYGIDNINWVPYNPDNTPIVSENVISQLIGREVRIGSIVKIKLDGVIRHAIVIEISDNYYRCALINLKVNNLRVCPDNVVRLIKGTDVIYCNTTYKEIVEVLSDVIDRVEYSDFIRGGGIIAGRVINELTMMKILKMFQGKKPVILKEIPPEERVDEILEGTSPEEKCDKVLEGASLEEKGDEVFEETSLEEKGDEVFEETLPEEKGDKVFEGASLEENGDKALKETPLEEDNDAVSEEGMQESKSDDIFKENDDEGQVLRFENIVENAGSLEELILNLRVTGEYLKTAIKICVIAKRCNLKNLLAEMKNNQDTKKSRPLSQNAIKVQLNEELSDWVANNRAIMSEYTLTYFLRTIVKGLKNK